MQSMTGQPAIGRAFGEQRERLATLRRGDARASDDAIGFDEIALLAARFCAAPIALVFLVDGSDVRIKSAVGITAPDVPNLHAFCEHAIRQGDLFEVCDLARDARFHSHWWVEGKPYLRFCARVSIVAPDAEVLGGVCVIDYTSRKLTGAQRDTLQILAHEAMARREMNLQTDCAARTSVTLQEFIRFGATHV